MSRPAVYPPACPAAPRSIVRSGLPHRLAAQPIAPGRAVLALLLASLFACIGDAPEASAQLLPPDADWQVLETRNFRVTFTPELEELARRAGDRAERAHARLTEEFLPPPRGKIDLILADNVDAANGL